MTLQVKKELVVSDEDGHTSERDRAIWAQHRSMMLLGGFFNAYLIKSLKPVLPSFVHGLSCSGLEDKLKSEVPLKFIQFAADTSGHDSSQFKQMIENVDNIYIRLLADIIVQKMRKYLYIPEAVKISLIKALL